MRPESHARWSRRLGDVGVGLIPGAIVVAVALSVLGSAYDLSAQAPIPQISLAYRVPPQATYLYGSNLEGFGYVAASRGSVLEYQEEYGGPSFLSVIPTSGCPCSAAKLVCPGFAQGFYAPGGATELFTECGEGPHPSALLAFNATNLRLVSNVSLATSQSTEAFAWDASQQRLFCLGTDSRLRTVDLSNSSLTANVSVPGGIGDDHLWWDSSDNRLIAGDSGNRSLLALDPQTGLPLASLALPGNVTSIIGDARANRLYADFSGAGDAPGLNGIAVLNSSSLAVVAMVPHPEWGYSSAFLDAMNGEVDFATGGPVAFLNESREQLIAPLVPFQGIAGMVTFDPTSGTFVIAYGGLSVIEFSFFGVVRSHTAPAPFSAFPVLGAGAPLDLGGATFLAGICVLAARSVAFPRPPDPTTREFEEKELHLKGSESARAEAARQRWIAKEEKRERR